MLYFMYIYIVDEKVFPLAASATRTYPIPHIGGRYIHIGGRL